MDCKATVCLGEYSRGGLSRAAVEALDHDMGVKQKCIPCGILNEDGGGLHLEFGCSYKTSDFMVDSLQACWSRLSAQDQKAIPFIQIKVDNGPESSGVRTQFLARLVDWVDRIGKSIQLLYFPPYHSKYNPIERCWGSLELHWNGALLTDTHTLLTWAKSMTWKGQHPFVALNSSEYPKGIRLTKKQMRPIETRLIRNPELPKWDILIHPT